MESANTTSTTAVCAIAAVVTAMWMIIWIGIINHLPRTMSGEAVVLPWWVCLAVALLLPILLPGLMSVCLTRTTHARMVFLLALILFALLWYFGLGFDDALHKAWRRGL